MRVNNFMKKINNLTIEIAFPDKETNTNLIKMFKIINFRQKNQLKYIQPLKRQSDYVYCELHHIIPKSLYRLYDLPIDNSVANTIYLTYVEHIKVHLFLRDYYKECNNLAMYHAMADAVRYFGGLDLEKISLKEEKNEIEYILKQLEQNRILARKVSAEYQKTFITCINPTTKKIKHIPPTDKIPENFILYSEYQRNQLRVFYSLYQKCKSIEEFEEIWNKNFIMQNEYKTLHSCLYRMKKFIPNFKMLPKSIRKRISITNVLTKENVYIREGDKLPNGFTYGYSPSEYYSKTHRQAIKKIKHCQNKLWITNPLTNQDKLIDKNDEIPHGWIIGRYVKPNLKWTKEDIEKMVNEYKMNGYSEIFKTQYNCNRSERKLLKLFIQRGYKEFEQYLYKK